MSGPSGQPSARIRWRVTQRPETWDRETIARSLESNVGNGAPDPRPARFTWLDQVHGTVVVTVTSAGQDRGAIADAAVTGVARCVLVVRSADCAPVLLEGVTAQGEPVLGVAHAGWRGLREGVVASTVAAMRNVGATGVSAWLGPCIGPECYEFGTEPLNQMKMRFGESVESQTSWGTRALDMPAAVAMAVDNAGATYGGLLPGWTCTACDSERRFSHRARSEVGRMALIARIVQMDAAR